MTIQTLKDLRMAQEDDLMNDGIEETDDAEAEKSFDDITNEEEEEEEF